MRNRMGLVGSALLGALLSALPLAAQHHPVQQNPEDLKIQQRVNKDLAGHDSTKDVQASVDDRIVTLTGSVDCYRDKLRAGKTARHEFGVEGVRDQIVVGGKPVPDDVLFDRLARKLASDRVGQGNTFNNFTLEVRQGVVTLGGQARTDVDRDSALAIIQDTCGIKGLVNQVKLLPNSPNDDRIRARVARAIYGDPVLQKYAIVPQKPIRIVVENGHVTLVGVVDSTMDRQVAGMRASEVSGVFSVTNQLVVPGQQVK